MPADPSTALLDRLWPLITERYLRNIACRPWVGDPEEHYHCLLLFRDKGLPPRDDRSVWTVHPSEALEITRWDDPTKPKPTYELDLRERHLIRLLATAILTYAEGHGRWHLGVEETEERMLESAGVIGPEFERDAAALIAWRIATNDER